MFISNTKTMGKGNIKTYFVVINKSIVCKPLFSQKPDKYKTASILVLLWSHGKILAWKAEHQLDYQLVTQSGEIPATTRLHMRNEENVEHTEIQIVEHEIQEFS